MTSLTIDDFERLPAEAVKHRELVDGELVDVSGNNPLHNLLRDYLAFLMRLWLSSHKIGRVITEQEYDFLGNAHGPDVSYFGVDKVPLVDYSKRVQRFVPDLAVEIASPNNTYDDLIRKKNRYRAAGTSEVWLISAENREIAIYSQSGDRILHSGDTITSGLLPGFTVTVDALFDGI
jgi:Uma2 family endonuclease